jgi:alkanesulfonate monooxygenase SsuD/methylene tetrahydromethanopterin reductase-like flavin-dependent oxidoreductase (luciferase family)
MTAREIMMADRFTVGLFSLNASGGVAMTTVPERWRAEWNDIRAVVQIADSAGLDFLLPLQRWRGYGGESDPRGVCMETMTHAAALVGITSRISLFATAQTSILHPTWTARALATIDHASGGRAGLNIVCGWNEHDFAMFGAQDVGADRRYDQGIEWTEIFSRQIRGDPPFDFAGKYFSITGAYSSPASIQPGGPPLMSAAFSPAGRTFAAQFCDVLFTTISSIDNAARHAAAIQEEAARYQRRIRVLTPLHVVCRPTTSEAEAYYKRYATDYADAGAVENYIAENARSGKPALAVAMRMQKKRISGGFGSFGISGSPRDIADQFVELKRAGLHGVSLSFVNFLDELPYFLEAVMPLLESAGLR